MNKNKKNRNRDQEKAVKYMEIYEWEQNLQLLRK